MTSVALYVTEYLVNNMLLPGQIENMIIVMDIKDFSVSQLPKKELKEVVQML